MTEERIKSEMAYPTEGHPFKVDVIKHDGMPPIIVCDGSGTGCPFKGRFHSATTCALEIKSNSMQINLCGKADPDNG